MKCHAVIVSESSSHDSYDNKWSIFKLVEAVSGRLQASPGTDEFVVLPLTVLAIWEVGADLGRSDVEVRLVTLDQDSEPIFEGDWAPANCSAGHFRAKVGGVAVGLISGRYEIRFEQRTPERGIERSETCWPLLVTFSSGD